MTVESEDLVTRFTPAEHRTLAQTGAGTPLGKALRHYWIPALLSEEIAESLAPPVRVRLLGEDLVAFRDADGRVGLLAEHCIHRGASLWTGRVDTAGIQCVYHGWTFDTDGNCVVNPTCPALSYDERVKQPSYPTVEVGGLIFAYLGEGDPPPLPDLGWLQVPDSARFVSKRYHPCHWLQALEADIDSAHVAYLHREDLVAADTVHTQTMLDHTDPAFEIDDCPAGLTIAAIRQLPTGEDYVRVNHWLAPYYTVVPADNPEGLLGIHAWVPIDDESCWIYGFTWSVNRDLTEEQRTRFRQGTGGIYAEMLPGQYVARRNHTNDYEIDRQAQHLGVRWSGVAGNQEQDDIITATMGPAYDRSRERLVPTDAAVIATRRRLLAMAHDVKTGVASGSVGWPGLAGQGYDLPSVFIDVEHGADWRPVATEAMQAKQVRAVSTVLAGSES
jgi:phenylpropionate dioxygenase-like ring-hydroxylating dioxygenase large terminal subunit